KRELDNEVLVLRDLVAHVMRHGSFPFREKFLRSQHARLKAFDSLETNKQLLQYFGRTVWSVAALKRIAQTTPFARDELGRARSAVAALKDAYVKNGSVKHPLAEVQAILGWPELDAVRRALVLVGFFPGFHTFSIWFDNVPEVVGMLEHVLRVDTDEFS